APPSLTCPLYNSSPLFLYSSQCVLPDLLSFPTRRSSDLRGRSMLEGLDAVEWASLTHAYGEAADVPGLIRELLSSDPEVRTTVRSEEHTSELQSHLNLVCRLRLEKKT